jgi:hypothetical protein
VAPERAPAFEHKGFTSSARLNSPRPTNGLTPGGHMTKIDDPKVAVPALMERARKLGPELGGAADQLNSAIQTAEKALAALKLGVAASVLLYSGEDGNWERLGFDKHGDAWRFVIEAGHALNDDHWSTSLLVNASRQTRREAVALFPDLLSALVEAAEAELAAVDAAARDAESFTTVVQAMRHAGAK